MSSPPADPIEHEHHDQEDDPMAGSGQEDDEGRSVGPAASDDSSEEPEEDEEEERRIREGFIVDEDDEEEEEEEDSERKKRRKRRKKRHHREEEVLEEDDLELLEENTGASFSRNKHRLTRLRRAHDSESPPAPSSSKRKPVVESSDEDLDNDDLELPQIQDIHNIWDDERAAGGRDDDEDMDDMDNFIDYEDEEETGGAMDEEEREERRRERRRREKERRRAMGSRPELAGIDANAWDEIYEVFGDGHDYDWALVEDEETLRDDEYGNKPDMKYQDVFEPSEIRARLLTEDDDLIRAHDTPERMQLATSSLSRSSTLSLHNALTENDLDDAASWVITRLSGRKERDFFRPDGQFHRMLPDLVQAITCALRYLFVEEMEVPYIWTHKRDYISYFNPSDLRTRVELLTLDDLWRVYTIGQKYRSLLERRKALDALYTRLGASDDYYENEIRRRVETVEFVADATEWLGLKFKEGKKQQFELHFHDDEEEPEAKKWKAPSRISAYDLAKKSVVSKLAQGFGIQTQEVVLNMISGNTAHFLDDPELNPLAYAEQFVDPDPTKAQSPEELLRRARMILSTELGKDPILRQEIRNLFKTDAQVSVLPTDRGISKITEHDAYFNFKYLYNKPVADMMQSSQFLDILQAESEHLVTISINISSDAKAAFERKLTDAFVSENIGDTARAWNDERRRVIQETFDQHLIPVGVKWTREWLREEAEDLFCRQCAQTLRDRVDVAPYHTPELQMGETPSVLALSWGKGDPHKDPIYLVFLDEAGRLREHARIDNLVDAESRDEFIDLVKRRRPDVIVIGGFTMATTKLAQRVKGLLKPPAFDPNDPSTWEGPQPAVERFDIPVIYVFDEVARIYQHSKRADEEFSALSPVAKYCVGLARYTQSPLNEYAALGADILTFNFNHGTHPLVSQEKLLTYLERVLVDVTNKVGVDINRAVADPYYQLLLPYVCGLGPRKAQVLVKKIAAMGGTLVNRDQFIKNGLLTTKVFLNAAGFLRITQGSETSKPSKNRHNEDVDTPDPLDNTRVHPEDYELARKMATDALELDEEDIHDEHPSYVVSLIMQDDDNDKKLSELNLDDFAVNMYETNQDKKRHTLNVIRAELLKPFGEARKVFLLPDEWDVVTMLSGETSNSLRVGVIVSVQVLRSTNDYVIVRLDSGIEGIINASYLADTQVDPKAAFRTGQALQGVVIDVKLNLTNDTFSVELSSRPADVSGGDFEFRRIKHDDAWNLAQYERDNEILARKKRAEVDRSRRVIKHPNFHNFNSAQAEAYLDKQQRGDVVIRPSSKGSNHLAVTWKVDDKLFQHIDVVEPNADLSGQTVGTKLIVDNTHQYSDLDDLIVNHVQAMARKVEELMAHEKFKQGPEDELHLFLKNFVAANPARSAYGFTLNRKRPGHFNLCFLANKNSTVQTWPVRVTPEAYYLFETPAAGVSELCDAFKVRHMHETQNLGGGLSGKTPYGGRTPARTPAAGHATPGRMSVRQIGRTPNPYGPGQQPPTGFGAPPPTSFGMPPPQTPYGGGFQTPYGGRPPPGPPPNAAPAGMNPQRAAMIQQSGWGTPAGRGW